MEISQDRFALALQHLKSSDWEKFERLSSAFLSSEWADLRMMASSSGDGGRDSELFQPHGVAHIVIQYSIQEDWSGKIRSTIARLKKTFPKVQGLIYVTNQVIGAKGDHVRKEVIKSGLFLDIRDANWFIERVNSGPNRVAAASELAKQIVDPFLESKGVLTGSVSGLTRSEAKAAFVFLELQLSNEDSGKGLTKSSFEALVRAALHGTHTDARINRDAIHKIIRGFLPQHAPENLAPFVDAALKRLSRTAVKHWPKEDSFCLSFDEIERLKNVSAQIQILNDGFEADIRDACVTVGSIKKGNESEVVGCVRNIIERYFARKGEEFATALVKDTLPVANEADLKSITFEVVPAGQLATDRNNVELLLSLSNTILINPGDVTRQYLKLLSDSYTLFAFLEETPDVQKVTKKLFTQGEIWLDTSAILPLFAEVAFPESFRPFTALFKQAKAARATLLVTPGILEEVERHLNLCLSYIRHPKWQGRVPYVYAQYALAGRSKNGFSSWVEQFCGQQRPQEDIADHLAENFGIEVDQPIEPHNLAPEFVSVVREFWKKVHDRRRGSAPEEFSISANRLAEHDVENCLTVLSKRKADVGKSPLGYTCWWFTLDSAAWKLNSDTEIARWPEAKFPPVISVDFLLKYLTFGPYRDQVIHSERGLAATLSGVILESLPSDLLSLATKVRLESDGLPERIVRRRIRDAVDREKAKAGPVQMGGLDASRDTISDMF